MNDMRKYFQTYSGWDRNIENIKKRGGVILYNAHHGKKDGQPLAGKKYLAYELDGVIHVECEYYAKLKSGPRYRCDKNSYALAELESAKIPKKILDAIKRYYKIV
jgi:hypothetical protein